MPPILPPMRRRARLLSLVLLLAGLAALPVALARDAEPRAAAAGATAKMRCFGAPSRDPVRPCRNPALATRVFPTPADALLYPNSPCEPAPGSTPFQCTFGVPEAKARSTIALVGDSHATHWRAAVDTVARAYAWRGVSMTRTGCTFSAAEPRLPGKLKQECVDWREQVIAWFRANPQVRTAFISQHPGGVVVPPGATTWRTQVQGYRDAWKALPRTVKHIVIIRDTPYVTNRTFDCVARARRREQDAGRVCALPRSRALRRDYAAEAAGLYDVPGVRVADMTRFMCSTKQCFPVVGGALTHKDVGHITVVFSKTLGPFLLRKVRSFGIRL